MSAAALARNTPLSGPRPVNLRTDLGAIADLIEICFADQMDAQGRAAVREMRAMSRTGPLLWLLSGLNSASRGIANGFVWIDEGRLVGNVSIYRADLRAWGWVIANVAVHPDYRRRGIARELMRCSLDLLRARGARTVVLQVMHDNDGAITLYRSLGFCPVRTWVTWRRSAYLPTPFGARAPVDLARSDDWRAIYHLAQLTRSTGLGWMRAADAGAFRPGFWSALGDFLSGKAVERYVVRAGDAVAAALTISMPLVSGQDVLTLMVHPDRSGELERPLLEYALHRLRGRQRAVAIEHPHDDEAGSAALATLDFARRQTLMVMRHDLG